MDGSQATLELATLRRALFIIGGVAGLARYLGMSTAQVAMMLDGGRAVPAWVLVKAANLVEAVEGAAKRKA